MARIESNPISLTTHHLHMRYKATGKVLSSGTGFIYKLRNENSAQYMGS